MKEKNQVQEDVYVLNPGYGIKADKKRAVIFQKSINPVQDKETTDILALMHPVYAIILSFFDGKWDYPDPRCPKAPKPERQTWLV
jgi:hypothetical protein